MKPRILFITHDANRAGAQLFLVNIMNELKAKGYFTGILMLRPWGGLKEDFIQAATEVYELPVHVPRLNKLFGKSLATFQEDYLKALGIAQKYDLIYANTIATASHAVWLKKLTGLPLISHIHELKYSLTMYSSGEDREQFLGLSDSVIACSQAVADNLRENEFVPAGKLITIHSFVDNERMLAIHEESDKAWVRKEFELPSGKLLIGACGNSEWRKGTDLFVNLAEKAFDQGEGTFHFIWIGARTDGDEFTSQLRSRIQESKLNNITLIPQTPHARELINLLDIFVVSSREDPFPLVMLEAALCEKPILGFEQTGGCTEFVKDTCGWLAPYENLESMYQLLQEMTANAELRQELGQKGQHEVLTRYSFAESFKKIEEHLTSVRL